MSKQGVTVSVPLHLFKDWAQDHKISVPNPPSGGLCISANGMTLGKLFIYKVPPTKTSVVFRRCTEVSQVINTNYAASYLCLQRTFVFRHQAISAQQNHMQRMKPWLQWWSWCRNAHKPHQRQQRGNLPSFLPNPGQEKGGIILPAGCDYHTCCWSPSLEECALNNPAYLRADTQKLLSPLFP